MRRPPRATRARARALPSRAAARARSGQSTASSGPRRRAGVSANSVNPRSRSSSSDSSRVHGTVSTWPIETRTQRRYSGSAHSRVEQHRVDAERGRAAEQAAEVLVVAQLLHHGDAPARRRATRRDGRQRPAVGRRDRAAVQVEAHDPAQHLGSARRTPARRRGRATPASASCCAGRDEHRTDRATRSHQRRDDERRLGDEEPPLGLDPRGGAPDRRARRSRRAGDRRGLGRRSHPRSSRRRTVQARRAGGGTPAREPAAQPAAPNRPIFDAAGRRASARRLRARPASRRRRSMGPERTPNAIGAVRARAHRSRSKPRCARVRLLTGVLVAVRLWSRRTRSPCGRSPCSSSRSSSVNLISVRRAQRLARAPAPSLGRSLQLLADTLVVLLVACVQHRHAPTRPTGRSSCCPDRGRDPVPDPRRDRELERESRAGYAGWALVLNARPAGRDRRPAAHGRAARRAPERVPRRAPRRRDRCAPARPARGRAAREPAARRRARRAPEHDARRRRDPRRDARHRRARWASPSRRCSSSSARRRSGSPARPVRQSRDAARDPAGRPSGSIAADRARSSRRAPITRGRPDSRRRARRSVSQAVRGAVTVERRRRHRADRPLAGPGAAARSRRRRASSCSPPRPALAAQRAGAPRAPDAEGPARPRGLARRAHRAARTAAASTSSWSACAAGAGPATRSRCCSSTSTASRT